MVINTAMLNEGDPDDSGIGLTYTVTSLATSGYLQLSGVDLALNDTFTQDDIDNGRLICEIGVAPVMPAEFVIFRIGQFTANAAS